MKSIQAEWEDYWAKVAPPNPAANQRNEMRKAFFCGAIALFFGIQRSLDPSAEPTDADLEFMERLDGELREFATEVSAIADAEGPCDCEQPTAEHLHLDTRARRGRGH